MKPLLFVIGDSISMHYGPWLESFLSDSFRYARKTGEDACLVDLDIGNGPNGGDSSMVLAYSRIMAARSDWRPDLLVVNCGLHDIKVRPGEADSHQIPLEGYCENLRQIFDLLTPVSGQLLWVRTTPVIDAVHNRGDIAFHRHAEDVDLYNQQADVIAAERGIVSADLFSFTQKLGGSEVYCDHVHYTDEVRQKQAAFLAGFVQGLKIT